MCAWRKLGMLVMLSLLAVATVSARPVAKADMTKHLDMIFVTVAKVQKVGSFGTYTTPKSGKIFVTVFLKVFNKNDVRKTLRKYEFKMITANGNSESYFYKSIDPELDSTTTLEPGGTASGTITYEVPKNDHQALLHWAPSSCSSDEDWPPANWTIKY